MRVPLTLLVPLAAGVALTACSTAPGRSRAESSGSGASGSSGSPATTSSAPPPPSPDPGPGRGLPAFRAEVSPITGALEDRLRHSHRDGCPVTLTALRHLQLSYVDFSGSARTGELVVHRDVAQDVVTVFEKLYAARWPVARMELVDVYGGDDDRSMAADNTSAYNCRPVAGTDRWSQHAYGRAIDLNPVENPYVQPGSIAPPAGRRYADIDRSAGASADPGVITAGDLVVRAFAEVGWGWGGDWTHAKDWQHFSSTGR